MEKPKAKTQRRGLGKVTISAAPSGEGSDEWGVKEKTTVKKENHKPYVAVQLNHKAKAMMEEGDQRAAYEANLIKKEKKKIADREGFEEYMQREAKREARKAKEAKKTQDSDDDGW